MNMKKFNRRDTLRLIKHNKRLLKNNRTDIDLDRTIKNVNLYERRISEEEYIKNRLEKVHVWGKNNEQRIYAIDWVLTAPNEIRNDYNECLKFFEHFTAFCNARYSNQNCIGAYCHFDEETPHIHYMFMPIFFDEKNNREKLCARDLIKRKELYSFHEDFQAYLYAHNMNYRVVNEDKRDRLKSYQNKSVEQLKYEREYNREREYSRWR